VLFELIECDGCLFGCGVVDDKVGVMVYFVVIWVYDGWFLVNFMVFVEGEEEFGFLLFG